jgi:hypothetical protein
MLIGILKSAKHNCSVLSRFWEKPSVFGKTSRVFAFFDSALIIMDAFLESNDWNLLKSEVYYKKKCDRTKFSVTLGSVDRASSPANSVTQVTTVKVVHEDYDDTNLNWDVALLKLATPVAFSSKRVFNCGFFL